MAVTLSILIPLTESRRKVFKPLHEKLLRQCEGKPVEILLNWNESDSVGKKRNDLLCKAKGEWNISADSDDDVSDDYVDKILEALKSNPDCVAIAGYMTTDGRRLRNWFISKDYGSWYERKKVYYRTPNHISPVRTSISRQVGFPDVSHGEDFAYSMGILPLLKTEAKTTGHLYHYKFISNK